MFSLFDCIPVSCPHCSAVFHRHNPRPIVAYTEITLITKYSWSLINKTLPKLLLNQAHKLKAMGKWMQTSDKGPHSGCKNRLCFLHLYLYPAKFDSCICVCVSACSYATHCYRYNNKAARQAAVSRNEREQSAEGMGKGTGRERERWTAGACSCSCKITKKKFHSENAEMRLSRRNNPEKANEIYQKKTNDKWERIADRFAFAKWLTNKNKNKSRYNKKFTPERKCEKRKRKER